MRRKKYTCFTALMMAAVIGFSMTACQTSNLSGTSSKSEVKQAATAEKTTYESKLFDTSYVHEIEINIDEEDWEDLKENPLEKTKYKVDITIDGEKVEDVSFATKGNTSLTSVASDSDSNRYSFAVNFGKYVDDQNYYGLNKLKLNNIYADATYMKEYISYQIFRKAGVEAPLASYVNLTVNGENQGLYLALEDIGESYLNRTRDGEGILYKPETERLGNMDKAGNMKDSGKQDATQKSSDDSDGTQKQTENDSDRPEPPTDGQIPTDGERPEMPTDGERPEMPADGERPEMPTDGNNPKWGPGEAENSKGADLKYTDDETSSYSDIFDNAETDAEEEDDKRVITALKGLSEGKDLEEYLDTEEVIRYFVAHNFVLNYDSYTGNMLHNYYLYENDGKLSMIPWDYNLAFGGFGGGAGAGKEAGKGSGNDEEAGEGSGNDEEAGESSGNDEEAETDSKNDKEAGNTNRATSLVNTGIDSPLSGTSEESRPMWNFIVSNEEYLEEYHKIYDSLITEYFESGDFEKEIEALYEMIKPYVEKDATAFYTSEEFETGYQTLKQFITLRAESIRAQLGGKLATVSSKQEAADKIQATDINVESMGSQGGGKDRRSEENADIAGGR